MGEPQLRKKPNLFEYTDYRRFLEDLYEYYKSVKPQFSYRYFSQRAGFNSPNILKLVIQGKRNLTPKSIEKFCHGLKLSSREGDFFKLLVFFNQSKKPTERAGFAEQMFQLLGKLKIHPLQKMEMSYYSHWFNIAVRELVATKQFKEDVFWIAEQFCPALNPSEVKKSLECLEELKLIVRNPQGQLVLGQQSVNTDNEVSSSLVANYHKKMLDLAVASIDDIPRDERELSAICVPVSESTAQIMKERIQKLREELLVLAAKDSEPERVYQINVQLFPLTKKAGAKT